LPGSARFSNLDRKYFMVIVRISVFEFVAILEYLNKMNELNKVVFTHYVKSLDEISRMLFGLIKKLEKG
jgi:four helix bundle protein